MTMYARTIDRRCTLCGARVTAALENGVAEFECTGVERHAHRAAAGGIGTKGNALEELYDRTAPDGPPAEDGTERVDRVCPVCSSGVAARRDAARRSLRFDCTGVMHHSWEIADVDAWAIPLERSFDLVTTLAPFGSGRRTS